MIANPTELRDRLRAVFEASPLTVAGQTFSAADTDEAIEEVIAGIVRSYMAVGGPTACERIVGAFFLALLEKEG